MNGENKVIINGMNFVKKYSWITRKSRKPFIICASRLSDSYELNDFSINNRLVGTRAPSKLLSGIGAVRSYETGSDNLIKNKQFSPHYKQRKDSEISNSHQLKIDREKCSKTIFLNPSQEANNIPTQISKSVLRKSSFSEISNIAIINKIKVDNVIIKISIILKNILKWDIMI